MVVLIIHCSTINNKMIVGKDQQAKVVKIISICTVVSKTIVKTEINKLTVSL